MKEKILVQMPIGARSSIELTASYANNLIREGNDVIILTCSGNDEACIYNPLGLEGSCKLCKKRTQIAIDMLDGEFEHVETQPHPIEKKFEYDSISSLKEVSSNGINIGYSALSTYATLTRSADIDVFHPKTRVILNKFLKTAHNLSETVKKLQLENHFERFVLFNARHNTYRSVFENGLASQIRTIVLENNFSRQTAMIYENAMPHNIAYNAKMAEELHACLGEEKAFQIADSFYQSRLNSRYSNEESYTAKQSNGLLPDDWKEEKRNFVLFNSSEDEFISIGGEWDENKLFDNQLDGMKYLSEFSKKNNLRIYLRLHPNQTGTQKSFLDKIYALSHEEFIVIPPDSTVSTYSLMLRCEKTITFGSSAGAEATYWNKPSLLLGNSFYKHLNITYNPSSEKELEELLLADLNPKPKAGCIKIACHFLHPGFPIKDYSFIEKKPLLKGTRIPKKNTFLRKIESKYTSWYLRKIR